MEMSGNLGGTEQYSVADPNPGNIVLRIQIQAIWLDPDPDVLEGSRSRFE